MHFVHRIRSRRGRASLVLTAIVILAIVIAMIVLLSTRSREPFDMYELYGWLD